MLTKKQKQTLDYIKRYIKENGYSPTLEEAQKHFKLSSVSAAYERIENLRSKGYLQKTENQPRSIELNPVRCLRANEINNRKEKSKLLNIPLLGTIAAGAPIEAVENPEMIKVPKAQLAKSGKHFALKVQGNSMLDEGIFDGDIVVIRKQPTAENGETVVALIQGNEVTLKKIYKEKQGFRLQPANPELKPIFARELVIQGKVISVIRTFEKLKSRVVIPETIKQKKIEEIGIDKIICGDAIKLLDTLPDNSIDLIICDGPYSVTNHSWDRIPSIQEYNLELIRKFSRVLKDGGAVYLFGKHDCIDFIDYRSFLNLITKIIWYQPSRLGQGRCRYTNNYDVIAYFVKGRKAVTFNLDDIRVEQLVELEHRKRCENVPSVRNGKYKGTKFNEKGKNPGDVWGDIKQLTYKSKELISREFLNTIQKPEKLIERLIKASSNPGDIILDPFIGTGATGVVASRFNRNFIGFEINPSYVQIAESRIAKAKRELKEKGSKIQPPLSF